ncbi:hypothetical protein FGG08_004725 [Glutinoglossum americanum]|uniref:Uncharacterized protein n=1 Tax=Glutinoglossum americanum TaxID=1670608 RepID=A0A9P8KZ95_9PEZI|nr:hypothetical protein FGG08_004725 [Glutinoglossum americanum]
MTSDCFVCPSHGLPLKAAVNSDEAEYWQPNVTCLVDSINPTSNISATNDISWTLGYCGCGSLSLVCDLGFGGAQANLAQAIVGQNALGIDYQDMLEVYHMGSYSDNPTAQGSMASCYPMLMANQQPVAGGGYGGNFLGQAVIHWCQFPSSPTPRETASMENANPAGWPWKADYDIVVYSPIVSYSSSGNTSESPDPGYYSNSPRLSLRGYGSDPPEKG